MKQNDFIAALEKALVELKPEEKQEILSDFREHFVNGMAGGKTEEEIAHELGDPTSLAAQFTEGMPGATSPVLEKFSSRNVLAIVGLLIFDIFIAIHVVATLFGIWVALWAMDVAIFACVLACFVSPLWLLAYSMSAMSIAGMVCIGVALLALGVLWSIGMCYVSQWSYRVLVKFIKLHVRIFKGVSA